MNILVLNCGSSTIKFQIISTDSKLMQNDMDRRLARGTIDRIGGESILTLQVDGGVTKRTITVLRDIRDAVGFIINWVISPDSGIQDIKSITDVHAIGHRVVHGGERFTQSALITDEVLRSIEGCIELAPLHNQANINGILAARELFGTGLPQVAVFDTAFHQTLPELAYLYALPYQFYRRYGVRRYGFHGTSHRYIAHRYRKLRDLKLEDTNIITLHLGNGCSATAIKGGYSVDTSMGFTPLEGLVMGTRSGDIDPAIVEFISIKEGLSPNEVDTLLNKQSGLLGVSGITHDMRELLDEELESNDRRARLSIDIFCYRVRKYIGAYLAAMEGADAIIFTGGIGENSANIRARIVEGLQWMGIELDVARNELYINGREGIISKDESRLSTFVIPTVEELMIARDTVCSLHPN